MFQLDVIKVQQNDIKVQTDAILALAKAEAAEEGTQVDLYKMELESIREQSKALGAQASVMQKDQQKEDFSPLWEEEQEQEDPGNEALQ